MGKLAEAKWLAVIVGAVVGIAIMLILGAAFSSTLEDADTVGEIIGILFGTAAVSYFLAGLVAGAWTRETKYGMYAALLLLVVNIIYNIVQGYAGTAVAIIIAIIFAIICGSLGGWIGKLVRR